MAPLETLLKSFSLILVLAFVSASVQAVPLTPSVTIGNTLQSDANPREGIELDLITGSSNTSVPTANPTKFANLQATDNHHFIAFPNTSSSKTMNTIHYLILSDTDVSVFARHFTYDDQLTLKPSDAAVKKPTPAATSSEPGVLALVGIGLLGFLGIGRHRDYY